jgi:hypothetical protein
MKSKTFTGRVYALVLLLGAGILVWAVIVHHLGAPRLRYGPCPKGSTLTYNWFPASSPIGKAADMPAGYPHSGIEQWFGSREIASCAGVLTVGLPPVPAGPLGRLEAVIPAGTGITSRSPRRPRPRSWCSMSGAASGASAGPGAWEPAGDRHVAAGSPRPGEHDLARAIGQPRSGETPAGALRMESAVPGPRGQAELRCPARGDHVRAGR